VEEYQTVMTTLADIAKRAGTSTSTVSRALKNDPRISVDMKKKITEIAAQEGYTKHQAKLPVTGQRWGRIGLIVPEVMSGYYARIVHLTNQYFEKQQYSVTTRITEFHSTALIRHLYDFAQTGIDGLLLVADDSEELSPKIFHALDAVRQPAMFITTSYISNLDYDGIYLDELRGITMGVEHLIQRGYKNIGFLGEQETLGRLASFREAMRKFHMPIQEDFIAISDSRAEAGGYDCILRLLSHSHRPDAVFASYDQMAIGAIKALQDAELRIPQDMALLGFDDLMVSQYIHKGITTIQNPCEDMISISCRILLNRIRHDESTPQQIALKPQLIIRGTT
jgi:DNA-binding LacI/PurR family transcriptional regulator